GTRDVKESILRIIAERTARTLMSVRNVSIQYSQNNGSILPGYLPKTRIMGSENYTPNPDIFQQQFGTIQAPGIPFIFGWQDTSFASNAGSNHLLTVDDIMNSPFVMTNTTTLNVRAMLEPISDLKVDLNAQHNLGKNTSQWFVSQKVEPYFYYVSTQITGTFSMSVIAIKTAFFDSKNKDGEYTSKAFDNFRNSRIVISRRLAQRRADATNYDPVVMQNDTSQGFYDGYGRNSQNVLLPAFLAAYTGSNADNYDLKENSFEQGFPSWMSIRPNWSINYNGLTKIDFVKRYIKTATVSHVYRSTFSVGGYMSNPRYEEAEDDFSQMRYEFQNDFVPRYDVNSASISEQFSPLIGFDLTWINSLSTKIEIKKQRTLALSFSNNQLNEMNSNEYVFGAGYRIKDVQIELRTIGGGGKKKMYKSDINLRADVSIRKSLTYIRKLEEGVTQPTAGQTSITLKTSADYVLSDRFILKLFFDRILTNPIVSTTFKTANTNFGVSVRFQLVQ
ncbi:MAG: cell surface protein SprA, partial [Bacteroidetes bacterium RIFOXYB2_FULL_35_7]